MPGVAGRSGRKPKPAAKKQLAGNPGKRALNKDEPDFGAVINIDPPEWLIGPGRDLWEHLAPLLCAERILQATDIQNLEAYCTAYGRFRDGQADITENGITVMGAQGGVVKNPAAVSYSVEWQRDNGDWVQVQPMGALSVEVAGIYAGDHQQRRLGRIHGARGRHAGVGRHRPGGRRCRSVATSDVGDQRGGQRPAFHEPPEHLAGPRIRVHGPHSLGPARRPGGRHVHVDDVRQLGQRLVGTDRVRVPSRAAGVRSGRNDRVYSRDDAAQHGKREPDVPVRQRVEDPDRAGHRRHLATDRSGHHRLGVTSTRHRSARRLAGFFRPRGRQPCPKGIHE